MAGKPVLPAGKQFMSVRDAISLAEQKRDAGQIGEAEALCRQVLQAYPQNAPALHLLGIIAHQVGNPSAGIELLQRAIAAKGDVALYHTNLGEMLRLSGRAREGVAVGRRAIELDPNHPSALNNLGIAYFDIEDYAAAEQCYRRALALDPDFAEAYSNLGNVLRTTKRLDEAVEAYNRALALKPNYPEAYNNLGTALRDQKKAAESEPVYRKALALRPDDPPTLNNLALALMELDRDEEAVEILTRSSTLDPRNGRTYVYLGSALFGLEQIEEAEVALGRGHRPGPGRSGRAQPHRGRILLDQGKAEAAVASFQAAIAKKPDMVDAHNNLGNALKELGRVEEAMECYYTARRVEPKATAVFINLVDAKSFKSVRRPRPRRDGGAGQGNAHAQRRRPDAAPFRAQQGLRRSEVAAGFRSLGFRSFGFLECLLFFSGLARLRRLGLFYGLGFFGGDLSHPAPLWPARLL